LIDGEGIEGEFSGRVHGIPPGMRRVSWYSSTIGPAPPGRRPAIRCRTANSSRGGPMTDTGRSRTTDQIVEDVSPSTRAVVMRRDVGDASLRSSRCGRFTDGVPRAEIVPRKGVHRTSGARPPEQKPLGQVASECLEPRNLRTPFDALGDDGEPQ